MQIFKCDYAALEYNIVRYVFKSIFTEWGKVVIIYRDTGNKLQALPDNIKM